MREVALSSLSPTAQERYRKEQARPVVERVTGEGVEEKTAGEKPWYVEYDFPQFYYQHKDEYDRAAETLQELQKCMPLPHGERTAAYKELAARENVDVRTIQNYASAVEEAEWWAKRLELVDGYSRHAQFQIMALCRKPRDRGAFPSIREEYKAAIRSIWFDKYFAQNNPSAELAVKAFFEKAAAEGWQDLPSHRTAAKYIKAIMRDPEVRQAHFLTSKGERAFRNALLVKGKRDATPLMPMEHVQGDEHTFDLWVSYIDDTGNLRAGRPVLVAWMDTRTRMILGDVICIHANANILKRSIRKMILSECGGVPKHLHMDNGKDYTAKAMTGQKRSERRMMEEALESDAALNGFYRSVGIQVWTRSKPYEPWGKGNIERVFGTVCGQFSKRFKSYVGTLTGSRTSGKVRKDVQQMLKDGELMTIEQFYTEWKKYLDEYHTAEHRGLRDAGETYTTPIELFRNTSKYETPMPDRNYLDMLLLEDAAAYVSNQGIRRANRLYTGDGLEYYTGMTVNIKYDPDSMDKLLVFDRETGKKICNAKPVELLGFGEYTDRDALERHIQRQKRHEKHIKAVAEEMRRPYRDGAEAAPCRGRQVVGAEAFMLEGAGKPIPAKVTALPQDKEARGEAEARRTYRYAEKRDQRALFAELDRLANGG